MYVIKTHLCTYAMSFRGKRLIKGDKKGEDYLAGKGEVPRTSGAAHLRAVLNVFPQLLEDALGPEDVCE
jgi:TfoX/Sxy family transcriptional regulator of competence genes